MPGRLEPYAMFKVKKKDFPHFFSIYVVVGFFTPQMVRLADQLREQKSKNIIFIFFDSLLVFITYWFNWAWHSLEVKGASLLIFQFRAEKLQKNWEWVMRSEGFRLRSPSATSYFETSLGDSAPLFVWSSSKTNEKKFFGLIHFIHLTDAPSPAFSTRPALQLKRV